MSKSLRIGFVPEHFSTPLHFAKTKFSLPGNLIPFLAGTGHMIQALKDNEIDISVGLTEGFVADLAKNGAKEYSIVGSYVETPLCWAISTGKDRGDISGVEVLKGKKVGVSRILSGSYVMAFVLADKHGWLDPTKPASEPPFEVIPLDTFARLRKAVNKKTADFFMWEHFTSKRYYDNGEIKRIGEIYTPWSSWKITARNDVPSQTLSEFCESVNKGISHFNANQQEAVEYISTELDCSCEDAREWLKTVRFPESVLHVESGDLDKTIDILKKAGVLSDTVEAETLVRKS
ncbi:MAG: hypothetical protein M1834_004446 [Cirrosporium novae-zelandiae]|nr:MAG: hypothetical protein M1834_004446 [Cirrosporium novae-zelandiae]